MKTFKFGQLLSKEDICNREKEIQLLTKVCKTGGRAVVYGPRRFGKTSVVKNVIVRNFLENNSKSLALYSDLLQLDSMEDMTLRLQVSFEQALSQRAKIQTFLKMIPGIFKYFRVEVTLDPISGAPTVSLGLQHKQSEKTLGEIFLGLKNLSKDYKTLIVLDEFQDIKQVPGLEAKLRSEIQNLDQTAVIALGSKKHILREIFHNESKPFYGFGIDIEFQKIPRVDWIPYIRERFHAVKMSIGEEEIYEICTLMRDVPNAIQELCQWIALSNQTGSLNRASIHKHLASLIENKSSRYWERLASLSAKEKKVLIAVACLEPILSVTSVKFLQAAQVSATATKAIMTRLTDRGIFDTSEEGYWITDPLFKLFLERYSESA